MRPTVRSGATSANAASPAARRCAGTPPASRRATTGAGRYGRRCSLTAIGPAPGPPPPCGVLNVLCRLMCMTSKPRSPGLTCPSMALRFAPSPYICAPCACTISAIRAMLRSKSPSVLGSVIISAATAWPWRSSAARRSSRSMSPSGRAFTATTSNPAIAAVAGFVPCAESGTSTVRRAASPRSASHAWITRTPANSPCAPAIGASAVPAMPVISASISCRPCMSASAPCASSAGCIGCASANPGSAATKSSTLGLSFIVQEPSGYMCVSIAQFICERRVKWRTTSSWASSGRRRSRRSRSRGGAGCAGTSLAGRPTPMRPGRERSMAVGSVIGERLQQRVDLGARVHLGDAQQHAVRAGLRHVEAADDAPGAQAALELRHGHGRADDELVEERLVTFDRVTVERVDAVGGVVCLLVAELGDAAEAARSERLEPDGRGERDELLARADVARRALAPDVLLARLQGEHVAGAALEVLRLADDAPGHLADVAVAAGEEPDVGPAERERDAERLAFGDDDVGAVVGGRAKEPEAHGVRGDDEERAARVRGFRPLRGVRREAPEEVGLLDGEARVPFGHVERIVRLHIDGDVAPL